MKAFVVYKKGEAPKLSQDFPMPKQGNDNEILLNVKAAAIKNLDIARASGNHYSLNFDDKQAKIVGTDAVGTLRDGSVVYAMGLNGTLAEKVWVNKNTVVPVPDNLDVATAASLPNAAMGSALALLFRAKMQANEVVLINGATGTTGQMAVQLAKNYGAKKIIATGRNELVLNELKKYGANIIDLKQDEEKIVKSLVEINKETPIDIVIDYLWGRPAELIFSALKSKGTYTHKTRFVTVGAMANNFINLDSGLLRSTDIQLLGSGLGTWTPKEVESFYNTILPTLFENASKGELKIVTNSISIDEIALYWNKKLDNNKRLVVLL